MIFPDCCFYLQSFTKFWYEQDGIVMLYYRLLCAGPMLLTQGIFSKKEKTRI